MNKKAQKTSYKSVKIKESDYLLLEQIRLHLILNKKLHYSKSELFSNILDYSKKLLLT